MSQVKFFLINDVIQILATNGKLDKTHVNLLILILSHVLYYFR